MHRCRQLHAITKSGLSYSLDSREDKKISLHFIHIHLHSVCCTLDKMEQLDQGTRMGWNVET
jgi:hypothetical protein